jgi:type I site-specific restriction endonuclease
LIDQVAGLPTGLVDDDQDAKQFDLLLLRTQLALLRSDGQFAGLKKSIVEIASELELVRNIPMVAAELALILELQTDEYWEGPCHTNLDRRGARFGRRADLRPRWRLATSGTLRLLGREACGGK